MHIIANTISFIIPTLNEQYTLPHLLNSICALEIPEDCQISEILVIDSNSSDHTVDIAKSFNCTVIMTDPGSVAASRNLGATHATGNFLAFVDADCILPTDWLTLLLQKFEDRTVVAAGAMMSLNKGHSSCVEEAWFELAHKRDESSLCDEVSWLASFNLVVTKEAFQSTHGFDEKLITCEDVDLGYKLSREGKLKKVFDSGVIHLGESKTVSEFFKREAWRARGAWNILNKNWSDLREVVSFFLPSGITILLLIALASMIAALFSSTPVFYCMMSFTPLLAIAIVLFALCTKKKVSRRLFIPCMGLLLVYFVARCFGTFRSQARVERSN